MSTLEISSLGDLPRMRDDVVARLTHVRRRIRLRLVVEGLAIVLAEAGGLALFTFWADHTFRLGLAARIALLAAAVIVLAYETSRRIIGPLLMPLDLVALAGAIGKCVTKGTVPFCSEDFAKGDSPRPTSDLRPPTSDHSDLAARVASILELPRLLEGRGAPSAAMIERAVRHRHEALAGVDFDSALDHARLRKILLLLAAALLVPTVLILLFPETAELWARRLFLASPDPWPQNTYLQVADVRDGRIQVPRGEPYVLRASARDGSVTPERIMLTIHGADKTSVLMKLFGDNDFRHDFAVVEQPLELDLEGGDADFGPILLDPVDRPRIVGLELTAKHPRQPAAEKHNFNGGDADLTFLVKTQLSLHIAANVPLSELRLKSQSAHPKPADLRRVDASHYVVEWVQDKAAKFDLELVAEDSGLVSLPVPVSVGLKVDQPPRVTMAYSGVRQRITPQAKVPLAIDARDDFGLAAVALAIKDDTPDPADPAKLVSHLAPQPLFPGDKSASNPASSPAELPKELQLKQTIDVSAKKLSPGSFLSLTAEATDDCYIGPQTNRSRMVTFGIVSPEELFREILLRQQSERVKFRKQTEEAEKIRDALQTAIDAKSLGEIARRHRALQLETLRIATVLNESLAEIKFNGLGSPESHALMERNVLAPLKALHDELIGPQTAAIDTLVSAAGAAAAGSAGLAGPDAEKLHAALDRQEQIVTRMKEVLKQMAQWDSFVDVLNQLDQIIKLETGVKDRSEKLERKETDALFDK